MKQSKNFVLLGSAGFVAPRHLRAIKDTGNNLVASLDKFDSVGILDQYFPASDFFVEFERCDRHIDKIKRRGTKIDYFSICTPNYLHDSHARFALKHGADVICEKPVVLNPWNVEALQEIESSVEKKVYTILQLRLHPTIIALKKKIDEGPKDKIHDLDLTYITSRGHWYYASWKGSLEKSGGIATNIGVHFFDMLIWIFGDVVENVVHLSEHDRAAGILHLRNARVRWFLSINSELIPDALKEQGQRTYRSFKLDNEEIEFSDGFTDLHTKSYQEILDGRGFGLEDASKAIDVTHDIRHQKPTALNGDYHPLVNKKSVNHPFKRKGLV